LQATLQAKEKALSENSAFPKTNSVKREIYASQTENYK